MLAGINGLQATFPNDELVRVAVSKGISRLTIDTHGVTIADEEGKPLILREQGTVNSTIIGRVKGFEIDGRLYEQHVLSISSPSGIIMVGGKKKLRSPLYLIQNNAEKKDNRFILVSALPLNLYLYGLINKEMIPSWPLEAKKAMAVAARTYTLFRKLNPQSQYYDLNDTAVDQVYGGFDSEDSSARLAVEQTRGEVLTFDYFPVEAYYHSTCGGHTASAKAVWGKDLPYLAGHECNYCKSSNRYAWKVTIGAKEIAKSLGLPASAASSLNISITKKAKSGHVLELKVRYGSTTTQWRAEKFRSRIGYQRLWSTHFTVEKKGKSFEFLGHGSGHGVGLCQWGAYGMAKAGKNYREILEFYYPGTEIRKVE